MEVALMGMGIVGGMLLLMAGVLLVLQRITADAPA